MDARGDTTARAEHALLCLRSPGRRATLRDLVHPAPRATVSPQGFVDTRTWLQGLKRTMGEIATDVDSVADALRTD